MKERVDTIDDFIAYFQNLYGDYTEYTEDEIRKAIDKLSFWVDLTTVREQFIVCRYLNFLSNKFNFNIDTNIDSR